MATTQTITYKLKEMKWIKDTDRLPEKHKPKCLRVRNTNEFDMTCGLTVGYWEYPYWYTPLGDVIRGSVEWLDESESSKDQEISSLNEILSQKMELLVKANEEIADLKRQLEKYQTNRYDTDDDNKRDPWDDLGRNLEETTF